MDDRITVSAELGEEQMLPAIKWMAEQIPGGFFVYLDDESQKLIYVNDTCLRIFGCGSEDEFRELTGGSFAGMVHPDDYPDIKESIETQVSGAEGKKIDYVEYRIIRRDGTVRWVDDYGHLTVLPGYGKVFYVFISDITEKHLALEDERRRAKVYEGMRDQFNAIADESLTVFRTNISTGIIEEIRGRDLWPTDYAGGLIAESARIRAKSFLVPGDSKKYEEIFALDKLVERYYKGQGPAVFVGYCRRASGRQCFVKYSGSAAIDPVTGDVIAFGVETEYNTEKVTEVLNQRVLAQQYDMVSYIVGDHYGVVIGDTANIRRGNIFPKKRDGVYSEYINDQVLPAASRDLHDVEELRRALSSETIVRRLEEADTYTVDVTCEDKGELFYKRFTYYLVDKDAQFYLLLKSDITDVLRIERERNQTLADALYAAEQANAAKTAFLSNMSHEIRTPMNAIIGLDSIALQSDEVTGQTREYLEKIGSSARHLLSLINDILDMSRIESGHISINKVEFSLTDMLGQISTMVQSQCRDKGLTFKDMVIGKVHDRYIGDDMKLKQVIINILSNAIKFTDAPGTVTFTVEQTASFEDNATLRFTISDTGIGMDESFLPALFDAFTQENALKGNKFGSTGLGMAITKNIVDMMNGTIAVSSKKGVGSTFTVTLTLQTAESSDEPAGPGAESDGELTAASVSLKGRHILLAEDVMINAEIMKQILGMKEMIPEHAENGRVALDMFSSSPVRYYDAILMDVRMPVMNGLEAASAIRALERPDARLIPIIALTANAFDEDVQRSLQAGMSAHLSKPVEPDHLYETISRLIAQAWCREDRSKPLK